MGRFFKPPRPRDLHCMPVWGRLGESERQPRKHAEDKRNSLCTGFHLPHVVLCSPRLLLSLLTNTKKRDGQSLYRADSTTRSKKR